MPRTLQSVAALCYDKKGRLLSVGFNSYTRTHPMQAKYAKKTNKPDRIYLHAELAALIKAKRRGKIHKLVVIRTGKNGQHMYAAPCPCCQLAIIDFDVKHVVHT